MAKVKLKWLDKYHSSFLKFLIFES